MINFSGGVSNTNSAFQGGREGKFSFNWHGSLPARGADENFTPNFRQFDFFLDAEAPDTDMVERVFKTEEGRGHWFLSNAFGGNIRAMPIVISSIPGAMMVNYMYTRLMARTPSNTRWAFFKCYATILAWNNFTKFVARERLFYRDWQRNQAYSYDELRVQRDQQRVREALYEANFVKNPMAEYRIKQWQVSERFA